MHARLALAVLAVLPLPATAQSISPGSTADVATEAQKLFRATDGGVVTNATVTAPAVTSGCLGVLPEEIQWGLARGFRGANGFVLSTGWVENGDEEVPPLTMGFDPTSCGNPNGVVGNSVVSSCNSQDLVLQGALSTAPLTADSVAYVVDFDLTSNAILHVAYDFVTYEDPGDTIYFDSFAILIDGSLVAGGTTNGGFDPAGDAWQLLPSQALPASEYNSLPVFPAIFQTPAYETGLRVVPVALPPGPHTFEYRLADGATVGNTSCGESLDASVDSLLFVGLHTYRKSTPGSFTPGLEIGRTGHPTVTGGPFGDDLQIAVAGATAGTALFLFQSPGDSPGVTIPLLSPLQIVVGLAPLQFLGTTVAGGTGFDVFPPTPPAIPPTTTGRFHYQWWGLGATGFECSAGLVLDF